LGYSDDHTLKGEGIRATEIVRSSVSYLNEYCLIRKHEFKTMEIHHGQNIDYHGVIIGAVFISCSTSF
jgi:hypothetical protein